MILGSRLEILPPRHVSRLWTGCDSLPPLQAAAASFTCRPRFCPAARRHNRGGEPFLVSWGAARVPKKRAAFFGGAPPHASPPCLAPILAPRPATYYAG